MKPHALSRATVSTAIAASSRHGMKCGIAVSLLVMASAPGFAQTRLLAPTATGAELAYAVAFDDQRLAAGAPGTEMQTGIVYTYNCAGQTCSAAAPLMPVDLDAGDQFGTAVSLSSNTLAIGAPGQDAGAAYVFFNDGFGWLLQQKLIAAPGAPGERFGASAAVLGDRLAIGAPGADSGAGVVYIFERVAGIWSQTERLAAADALAGNALGSSVALAAGTIVAGAPHWHSAHAGSYSQGAAYVFESTSPGWIERARLQPLAAANGQFFGHTVSLSGNRALIGAPLADLGIGTAFVFQRNGQLWTQQAQLADPLGLPGDRFGWAVALDGDQALVGAPYSLAGCGGTARFSFTGGAWNAAAGPALAQAVPGGLVGWSVAAGAGRVLVGVPGYSGAPSHVGAAYWRDAGDSVFGDGFDGNGADLCLVN